MKNEELLEKYPFLKINDSSESGNWSNCWLDDLEPGWRKAFGNTLCEELAIALKEDDCEKEFHFEQIKEKYGALRLYASGYGMKTRDVLTKYEELSKYICGHCGKPATKITRGWIYPLCDSCIEDIAGGWSSIENFYDFDKYEDVQKEIERIKTDFNFEDYYDVV